MEQNTVEQMEQDILALNLSAPRVTLAHVTEMMKHVTYEAHRVPGTNTTQVTAHLHGFTLATGETSCVQDENFNADLGLKYARENAVKLAQAKLYELEGWRLFCNTKGKPKAVPLAKGSTWELNDLEKFQMFRYACHKAVHATPMTRGDYNDYRGWEIPADENPADPGYLVIYNKDTADHYESWSPEKQFDDGYLLID